MAHAAFDTLKFVEILTSAGITEKQAKAFSRAQTKMLNEAMNSTLVTKTDIRELKQQITGIEATLKLLQWMMGFLLSGVLGLVIKTFFTF